MMKASNKEAPGLRALTAFNHEAAMQLDFFIARAIQEAIGLSRNEDRWVKRRYRWEGRSTL